MIIVKNSRTAILLLIAIVSCLFCGAQNQPSSDPTAQYSKLLQLCDFQKLLNGTSDEVEKKDREKYYKALLGVLVDLNEYRQVFLKTGEFINLFPTAYFNTTLLEMENISNNEFDFPVEKMQQMLEFYHAYQYNRSKWETRTAEQHWTTHFNDATTWYANLDAFCAKIGDALGTAILAHVKYDLPRAIRVAYSKRPAYHSALTQAQLVADFNKTDDIFKKSGELTTNDAGIGRQHCSGAVMNFIVSLPSIGFWKILNSLGLTLYTSDEVISMRHTSWTIAFSGSIINGENGLPLIDLPPLLNSDLNYLIKKGNELCPNCKNDVYIQNTIQTVNVAETGNPNYFKIPFVANAACYPVSDSGEMHMKIKIKKEIADKFSNLSGIFGAYDSTPMAKLKDMDMHLKFQARFEYNSNKQVSKIITQFDQLGNAAKRGTKSMVADAIDEDAKKDIDEAFSALVVNDKYVSEYRYNDKGQVVEVINPFGDVIARMGDKAYDIKKTIHLSYDDIERINKLTSNDTTIIMENGNGVPHYSQTTTTVSYLPGPVINCTTVLSCNCPDNNDKQIREYFFDSKLNLQKEISKKNNKQGQILTVSETTYEYYSQQNNPTFFEMDINFINLLLQGNTPFSTTSIKTTIRHDVRENIFDKEFTAIESLNNNCCVVKSSKMSDTKQAYFKINDHFFYDPVPTAISSNSSSFRNNTLHTAGVGKPPVNDRPGNKPIATSSGAGANNKATANLKKSSLQSGTVADIDGNIYKTIKIGGQEWMAMDLRVSHFRNNEQISYVNDGTIWQYIKNPVYCRATQDTVNAQGFFYNWYAVNDPRGIAPVGWHIATDADWNILIKNAGGDPVAGSLLKSATAWQADPKASGLLNFEAIPLGRLNSATSAFEGKNSLVCFWSATGDISEKQSAWVRILNLNSAVLQRVLEKKTNGYIVRCVKD